MRRVLLVLVVLLGLSPGLLWRNEPRSPDHSQRIALTPLIFPADTRVGGRDGPLLTGAWRLTSPNTDFGSYSALVATGGNELLAISDRGQFLRLPVPGTTGPVTLGAVLPGSDQYKLLQDMESATRDPHTGQIWIGLEFRQSILRLDKDLHGAKEVRPPQMRRWRPNGGPESFALLKDGRFVMLAEAPLGPGDSRPALLFAGDPVDHPAPVRFRFAPPEGYDPSDMALLPDGRMLILLRGLRFVPPSFAVRLVIADPADIKPGREWGWRDVGTFVSPVPIDNYEGLAVTGGANGGPVTLWVISDDNQSLWLQRTLLLRFAWQVPRRS
jgi:hypothetical protein